MNTTKKNCQQSQQTQSLSKNSHEIIRLDKFVSSQISKLSRNDVKNYVKKGRIFVNGKVALSYDMKINTNCDDVTVDNEKISYKKFIYIMLNKPQGVVCSTKDGLSPTVLSLVPKEMQRKGLFPAGRLDKDTVGFVLITDDGEFSHKILSPKNHVPKTYFVVLEKPCEKCYKDIFEAGITIDGGDECMPAEINFLEKENECYLTIKEGMFHQVKRMFKAVGNEVTFLKRIRIGGLDLDSNLPEGACLELLHKDLQKIV